MKITCLSENTSSRPDIEAEHGLSLYIETNGKKLLFDMGQGTLFIKNAEALGVDVSDVDIAVISHGHYDHGGGLEAFLSANGKAPVYVSRHAFGYYYNAQDRYIGLDRTLSSSDRLIFTDKNTLISDGITLYTKEEIKPITPPPPSGLTERSAPELPPVPDAFCHEMYMLIQEGDKRILISGCSHRGVLDIMRRFSPDVFVGGFHLSKIDDKKILAQHAKEISGYDTELYTCHCTGYEQYKIMKAHAPRLCYLSAGNSITI